MPDMRQSPLGHDDLQNLVSHHLLELVWFRNLDGRVTLALASVEKLLGFTPEAFVDNFETILVADSCLNREAVEVRQRFIKQDGERESFPVYHLEFTTAEGRRVVHEVHEVYTLRENERIGSLCVSVDVTEHRDRLAELEDSNQGLMVVHHTQKMLMNAGSRDELLAIALDAPVTMLEFSAGLVYALEAGTLRGEAIASRGLSSDQCEAIGTFAAPDDASVPMMQTGEQTTALLLPPDHPWLEGLKIQLGTHVCGIVISCMGRPQGVAAFGSETMPGREALRLLQAIGSLVAHALEDVVLKETVSRISFTDTATGLYSRNYAEDFLVREERLIHRHNRSASIILMRLVQGDGVMASSENQAVVDVAGMIRSQIRTTDLVARYDNAEFLIYLPETDSVGAMTMVDRCVQRCNEILGTPRDDGDLKPVIGVSTTEHGMRPLSEILSDAQNQISDQLDA